METKHIFENYSKMLAALLDLEVGMMPLLDIFHMTKIRMLW